MSQRGSHVSYSSIEYVDNMVIVMITIILGTLGRIRTHALWEFAFYKVPVVIFWRFHFAIQTDGETGWFSACNIFALRYVLVFTKFPTLAKENCEIISKPTKFGVNARKKRIVNEFNVMILKILLNVNYINTFSFIFIKYIFKIEYSLI